MRPRPVQTAVTRHREHREVGEECVDRADGHGAAGNGGAAGGRAEPPRRRACPPRHGGAAGGGRPTAALYWAPQMRFRVLWRRAATAVGIYGSALFGILATIVAARELSNPDFARFALVFAITGLLQLFLDLTIDEVVVKYGNRYAARGDWGRFQRLFAARPAREARSAAWSARSRSSLAALLSPWIWTIDGLRGALLVAALIPLVQAPEGMASAALLSATATTCAPPACSGRWRCGSPRSRSARRSAWSRRSSRSSSRRSSRRVTVSAVGARTRSVASRASRPSRSATTRRRSARSRSSRRSPSGLHVAARAPAARARRRRRDARRRSAYFRIAQAPQTAFASLSAPARIVLLAEQTRDVEHGRARPRVRAPAPLHRRCDRRRAGRGVPLPVVCDAVARSAGLRRELRRRHGCRRG